MSLIPAFELGLWNAWLFVVPQILLMWIGSRILNRRKMASLSESLSEFSKGEKKVLNILTVLIFGSYIYSIFLPMKTCTIWFYIGITIFIFGIITQIIAWQNLAAAPVDKPVTKGIYYFSRNPMYIGDFLIYIGITVACLSWVFLIVLILAIFLDQLWAISEELECIKKYGESYREYMEKIPRWIGKPKTR